MKSYFNLEGKVALVTGGSSGLGVQMAKALANQGATVVLTARRVEKLKGYCAEIQEAGGKADYEALDVGQFSQVESVVKSVIEKHGKIDILLNAAGIGKSAHGETQSIEDWKNTLTTNLDGTYYMCREVGRHMIERGEGGRIINIGSIHSEVGMKASDGLSAYAASKGGVKMLTKQLAVEWAKHNITVNAIGPAYFPSEMTQGALDNAGFQKVLELYNPSERAGRDGELDTTVIYLSSDYSTFVNGQIIYVDGGWTAI